MRPPHLAVLAAVLFATAAPADAMGINTPESSNPGGGMKLQSADPVQPKAAPKKKRAPEKSEKKSERPFVEGYRYAHDLIYERENYAEAIAALRALGRDDHPDVANLIGFASRKLGRTEDARHWYEVALAADPAHARTWQYYGMWHLERGDREKAEMHLEKIRLVCGETCTEFTSLREALNGEMSY